jgi:hypothetical protein
MTVPTKKKILVENFGNVPDKKKSENLGNFRFFSANYEKICL